MFIAQAEGSPKDVSFAFFVGHSRWNKGALGINRMPAEWDYCDKIAKRVLALSQTYPVHVKIFYRGRGKYRFAIDAMYQQKNRWNSAAPVISCHYNMTPHRFRSVQRNATKLSALFKGGKKPRKGSLVGTLILYKPGKSSKKLAQCLLKNVLLIMPRVKHDFTDVTEIAPLVSSDRGGRLAFSPYAAAPVVLLEIGYGDNDFDSQLMLKENLMDHLAIAILKTASRCIG